MIDLKGSAGAYELFLGSGLLPIYFGIMWMLFSYIFYKYKVDKWTIFVVFLFTPNFFQYLGIEGFYKIALTIFTIYLFFCSNSYKIVHQYPIINLFFALWSIWFFISCFVNEVPFLMTFSQYGIKYLFIFFMFFVLLKIQKRILLKERIYKIVKYCLLLQSVLSIVKFVLWRILGEALVGSLTTHGGGPNNIIPIVGFLLVWSHNKGHLSKQDWFYCLFLLISPVFGGKRSIWFFFPFVVGAILLFAGRKIEKKMIIHKLIKYIPLLIIVFVLGVKLNPSLNPEKKYGGSFDIEYLLNYSTQYTFGKEENAGRGGMFITFISNIQNQEGDRPIFGYGLDIMKMNYESFNNEMLGSKSKGEIGAVLANIYSFGLCGSLFLVFFLISILCQIKNNNVKIIIIVFMLIEYVIFYNELMMNQSMFFVLLLSTINVNKSIYLNKDINKK